VLFRIFDRWSLGWRWVSQHRRNVGKRGFSTNGLSEHRHRLRLLDGGFQGGEGLSEPQLRLRLARSPIDCSHILDSESCPPKELLQPAADSRRPWGEHDADYSARLNCTLDLYDRSEV